MWTTNCPEKVSQVRGSSRVEGRQVPMASREENRRLAEAYAEAMGIGDTNLPDELTDDSR